jgi:putative YphP/YqiW family bacilliredoxin
MFAVKSQYPEKLVEPMRKELTDIGVEELRNAADVENVLSSASGTVFLIVNSVCGCAAGSARPGVALALKHDVLPDRVVSVFAGVDFEAVEKARSHIMGYPPSSPSMALFKDGQLVHMMPRYEIEGKYPEEIASALKNQFNTHCK